MYTAAILGAKFRLKSDSWEVQLALSGAFAYLKNMSLTVI